MQEFVPLIDFGFPCKSLFLFFEYIKLGIFILNFVLSQSFLLLKHTLGFFLCPLDVLSFCLPLLLYLCLTRLLVLCLDILRDCLFFSQSWLSLINVITFLLTDTLSSFLEIKIALLNFLLPFTLFQIVELLTLLYLCFFPGDLLFKNCFLVHFKSLCLLLCSKLISLILHCSHLLFRHFLFLLGESSLFRNHLGLLALS